MILVRKLKKLLTTVLSSASKNCSFICNNQSNLDFSKSFGRGTLCCKVAGPCAVVDDFVDFEIQPCEMCSL